LDWQHSDIPLVFKAAITFSLQELEAQTAAHPDYADKFDTAFNSAAAKLLAKAFSHLPTHGFYHWDAARTLTSATPLFARDEIMTGLKQLASYRDSTLLVTNLRPALIPPPKRAVGKRLQEYQDALAFIRDLAAARTAPSSNLQLLFL